MRVDGGRAEVRVSGVRGILFRLRHERHYYISVISVTISLKTERDIFRIVFIREPAPFIQFRILVVERLDFPYPVPWRGSNFPRWDADIHCSCTIFICSNPI